MEHNRPLGILMLDTKFPRIPGDVGNPDTFPFPVKKLLVEGADPASTPVRIMTAKTAVISTDTCAAIGMELEQVKSAFSGLGITVIETTTQQEF